MLSVVAWSWGGKFPTYYVERLASMLQRNLSMRHQLVVVTDAPHGLSGINGIRTVRQPVEFSKVPRCIRRLRMFDKEWTIKHFEERILMLDLDLVITGNVTSLFNRPEPVVLWDTGRLYCGGMVLMQNGALHGLWKDFSADPVGYARTAHDVLYPNIPPSRQASSRNYWGFASDQPVLTRYVKGSGMTPATWRENKETGILGYEKAINGLPDYAKIVFFESQNGLIMEQYHAELEWMQEHWR